ETTVLHPNLHVENRKLIREIGKAKAVILSTHILPEVEATCDRILIINKGKIVADGTADTLRQQAAGQEVVHLQLEEATAQHAVDALTALPEVAAVSAEDGGALRFEIKSQTGRSSRRAIFKLCVERGWVITEMTPVETRLEDIFRNLTVN